MLLHRWGSGGWRRAGVPHKPRLWTEGCVGVAVVITPPPDPGTPGVCGHSHPKPSVSSSPPPHAHVMEPRLHPSRPPLPRTVMLQRPRGPSHRQREMGAGTSRAQAAPSLGTGRVVTALPGDHREHSFLHVMAQFTALWWDAKMHIQSQGGWRRDGRRRVSLRPGRTLETGHRALQPW